MEKTKDVTAQIIDYVKSQNISISQMSQDLGIPSGRFAEGKERTKLSASEFLEICVYLGIRPEKFQKRRVSG